MVSIPPHPMEICLMPADLILRQANLGDGAPLADIVIREGRIAAITPPGLVAGEEISLEGGLVLPGFVETHIHLDKSCIIDRCDLREGSLAEAIRETARAKLAFSEDDIEQRARRTLEKAIMAGTMKMRTHVEIDPRIGLKGFHSIQRLAKDYTWAIDIEICVFPQEGLINDPGCEELLIEACRQGASLIGGCPYADTQPDEHIARIFAIARTFDLDIDFHLDFDLDTRFLSLTEVCRQTRAHNYAGRVTIGHVTKLSALPSADFVAAARLLASSGVAVTVLPSTDLFLMGRGIDHNVPRGVTRADLLRHHGVTCSLATNNVLNAFTPFGDCSLCRIANLYANIAQLGRRQDLEDCLAMVTSDAARLMNIEHYGVAVGHAADLLVFPTEAATSAIAEIVLPRLGFKNGRRSFFRADPVLNSPVPRKHHHAK